MSWADELRKIKLQLNGVQGTVNTAVTNAVAQLPTVARTGNFADIANKPTTFAAAPATISAAGSVKPSTGLAVTGDGTLTNDGVLTFNTRKGAITLTTTDVTTALGFTPMNSTARGAINGVASLDAAAKIPIAQIPQLTMTNITVGTFFSAVATSGNYTDLTGRPTLATVATSGSYVDLANKPTLSTVATTGSYADLTNKPTSFVPPIASAAVLGGVKAGTGVTIAADGVLSLSNAVARTGNYADLTNRPTALSAFSNDLPYASITVAGLIKIGSGLSIDGSGFVSVTGSTGSPYDIAIFVIDKPDTSEPIFRKNIVRAFTIPANFTGSIANATTAATGSTVFKVNKNGSQVATITFAAASTNGTFSTQAAVTFNVGDKLTVVAPATVDATLANIDITILANTN